MPSFQWWRVVLHDVIRRRAIDNWSWCCSILFPFTSLLRRKCQTQINTGLFRNLVLFYFHCDGGYGNDGDDDGDDGDRMMMVMMMVMMMMMVVVYCGVIVIGNFNRFN